MNTGKETLHRAVGNFYNLRVLHLPFRTYYLWLIRGYVGN
jgi:hypothetical protein